MAPFFGRRAGQARISVTAQKRVKFNINWISLCLAVYVFGFLGHDAFILYQRQKRIDIYVARIIASFDAASAERMAHREVAETVER
jgi:hypothetical protein